MKGYISPIKDIFGIKISPDMRESIGDSLRGCIKDSNEAGWIL